MSERNTMRAESLSALIVSADDAFCRSVADCLRWSGAERALRVRTGRAARAELQRKRFFYSVIILHIVEDESYDVDFIESVLRSRDLALRSIPCVAIASARSRAFYAELSQLGFAALVPAPVNRVLLRETLVGIFRELQMAYRNPDLRLLRRALGSGDLDFVEERCARALQHQPDHRAYSAYLGEVFFRQGQLDKALEKSEAAIQAQDGGSAADGYRLKAKILHKKGLAEQTREILPFVLKLSGENESLAIFGLVPVLNSHAAYLKSSRQVEEALLFYKQALAEPDAREHESRLYLNIALAHVMAESIAEAYEAAEKSLAFAGGHFQKAKELLAFLRKSHPEILAARESRISALEGKIGAGVAAKKARQLEVNQIDEEASSRESSSADLSAGELQSREADLTEEVELPGSGAFDSHPSEEPLAPSVFEGIQQLGQDGGTLAELDSPFRDEGASDLLGDALLGVGVESDSGIGSPEEFDFDVSADAIEAAKEAEARELEEYRASVAEREAMSAAPPNTGYDASTLDGILEVALSSNEFSFLDSAAASAEGLSEASSDALALASELSAKSGSVSDSAGFHLGELGMLDQESGAAAGEDLAGLIQMSATSTPSAQSKSPSEPSQSARVSPKPASATAKAASGGGLDEILNALPIPPDASQGSELPGEQWDEDSEEASNSSHRLKWDVMSREQIMDFLLFSKEYPKLIVKRLKVRPRRRHDSLVPLDQ